MNSMASADPFADSVARVVRAQARDGLSGLGHSFVFAGAGWGFLVNLLVWATVEAVVYLLVGSCLLWRYLR